MNKNPLKQSQYIKDSFSKYIKSTFVLKNKKYNEDFKKELDRSVLYKGPFLKLELPFKKSYSINELINKEEISPLFVNVSDVDLDRPLYLHQYKAIKQILKGSNIVVTTGTGSGKTESFFYPILNNLLEKIQQQGSINGIHAILLYPMNALVNDQLERLRKHLSTVPEISFGFFTGDTPENYKRKLGNGKIEECNRQQYIHSNFDENDIKPPINEVLTRKEVRKSPPNILITNFSMLEYLLVRPKDSAILNADTMKDWSFMVLDEAHTYRGTLATEVSHLLKRLQAFANKQPQFILTSATLGNTDDDKKDIIEFASKLTSVSYSDEDVIYSERILPTIYPMKYKVKNEEYIELAKQKDVHGILGEYGVTTMFDLLSQDENVHYLYSILKKTDTFDNVYQKMKLNIENFSEDAFISLINLVTKSEKDGLHLYDIKYHFLIRTLEGAFISLNPQPKLRIRNRQTIDDMWAFEIGACKYCNVMYIIGKEYNNYLFRSELDLDENYQNFDELKVDFYLLKDDVIDSISGDLSNFEEYTVCSKCGFIFQNNQHNRPECTCGIEYNVLLLKVISDGKTTRTNLITCSVCEKKSNKTGVVNSFKLWKDQSTALLSQILLKSMDLYNNTPQNISGVNDIFTSSTRVVTKDYYKQFLAFSDSRQQASFFALWFQENQNKFLRKALVLKNLTTSMRIDGIIAGIERMIEDNNLFTDNTNSNISSTKNAYICVLLELFKSDGINSLEGLGLLSFEPDFTRVFEHVNEDNLSKNLPKIKLNQLQDLLCIYIEAFRIAPAINYDNSGLTWEDRKEFLEYRKFDNYVMLEVPPKNGDKSLKSILPVKGNNDLVRYLKKTFDLSSDEVKQYAVVLWRILTNEEIKIIEIDDRSRGKINFSRFNIYKKEDKKWFVCDKCNNLTTHNINDCCVKGSCEGILHECDPDEFLKDNYYRNEYLEKKNKIERIVVQEHTAQLTREKGKEYQKGFKNKNINVLSTSTTFEMGVNIGSLDTVLMRNIPPTNANYAQRAGRAGRSDQSVAFIVTYANHNSHDQIYFSNPVPMIDGIIKPPYFKLDNNKISIRHIMAFLISYFYRSNNFDDTLKFFLENVRYKFLEYIDTNKTLLENLMKNALNQISFDNFKNYRWLTEMNDSNSLLNKFVTNVNTEISNLKSAEERAKKNRNYADAKSYKNQINNIQEMDIVKGLAKYNVIPGYGFAIDVVSLKIYDRIKRDFNKGLDLNRDLAIALSEYAPDSEIIVDKNKYTSRYIILPKEGDLPKYFYYKCQNDKCEKIHVNNTKSSNYNCETCNFETKESNFIVPNLGFITDEKNKDDTILKPRKTYASEVSYLGSMEPFITDLKLKDFLLIQQTNDDKLLIVNENPFFSCPTCGYSVLDKKKKDLDDYDEKHKTFRSSYCENTKISKIKLGHIIITDVIKMRINLSMKYEIALSTITAVLNGISSYLQIDSNDINGIIIKDKLDDKYAFIFYDTTYGGAGNVKQLTNQSGLKTMMQKAFDSVSIDCCDENVSCTSCLRNYKNSKNHKYLKRKYARDTLKEILSQIE